MTHIFYLYMPELFFIFVCVLVTIWAKPKECFLCEIDWGKTNKFLLQGHLLSIVVTPYKARFLWSYKYIGR